MSKRWPNLRLGELLRLDLDKVRVDAATSYPMVGVLSFGRGLFEREPIENGNTSYKHFYRLKAEHIVMSQLFGWEGALSLSSEKFSGKFLSPQFPTFLCDTARIDRSFLGWALRRPILWADLSTRATGMGDRRRTLNPDALFACEIPLPPMAEQRRIVARIEELVAHIHEARDLRQQEEQEIQQMLHGMFQCISSGASRYPMRDIAPQIRRPVQIDDQAWYPELGVRSFGKGTFHKPALTGFEIGNKRIFKIEPGDLIFSNVFAWEGAIAVAKPEDAGRVGSHRFITCVPKPEFATARFLNFYFLTREGIELIRAASPGGAGRNRTLGLAALDAIEVPVPSIEQQRWFDELQVKVDELKRLQAEIAVELDALLPSILNRAFKGEL